MFMPNDMPDGETQVAGSLLLTPDRSKRSPGRRGNAFTGLLRRRAQNRIQRKLNGGSGQIHGTKAKNDTAHGLSFASCLLVCRL
jgi:hypothetical protein